MATSRTGTTRYLRARAKVLRESQAGGLTHCPGYPERPTPCGRELDYETPLLDNSAETDHILEHRHGGSDEPDNLRVLCRACNRERNHAQRNIPLPDADDFPLSRAW